MRILFKDSRYHGQRQYEKPVDIYPAHLGAYATYLRNEGYEVSWFGKDDGKFDAIIDSDLQIPINFENLTQCVSLTIFVLSLVRNPSSLSGYFSNRYPPTIKLNTASPKNSSLSFEAGSPFSTK